jgi:hypothetical protein
MLLVAYEDKRGPQKRFGLHELLLACLLDLGIKNARDRVDGQPKKGSTKLIGFLTEPRLVDRLSGDAIVVLFDSDRLPVEALGLPKTCTREEFVRTLKAKCSMRDLQVFFLDRNLEDVLRTARDCEKSNEKADQYRRAIERKALNERDIILIRIANDPLLRRCVYAEMKSLRSFVEGVAALLG